MDDLALGVRRVVIDNKFIGPGTRVFDTSIGWKFPRLCKQRRQGSKADGNPHQNSGSHIEVSVIEYGSKMERKHLRSEKGQIFRIMGGWTPQPKEMTAKDAKGAKEDR